MSKGKIKLSIMYAREKKSLHVYLKKNELLSHRYQSFGTVY